MNASDSTYRASWRHYRWWYAASLVLFVAFLPVFALAANRFPEALRHDGIVITAFLIYAGTWARASNVALRWKCPRCGKYFFGDLMASRLPMLFVRSCRNCGLPKYANADYDPSCRS
jgi:hypothetical protein